MSEKSQIEDIMAACIDFQREYWQSFAKVAGFPTTPFKQSLQTSEDILQNCIRVQCDCGKAILKSLNPGEGAPDFVSQYYDNMQDTMESCMDISKQAMDNWFKGLEGLDPYGPDPATRLADSATNMFQAWQRATEESLQAQSKFMSLMLSSNQDATGERGSRSPQRKATKAVA